MKIGDEIKQEKFRNDYQKVVVNLMFTSGWLATRQEELFKPFGITPSQFNILRILRGQGKQSMSGAAIKERMLERNSDISRMLDRLAKKELIVRTQCPNDKRATDVHIAPAGLKVLKAIDATIDQAEKKMIRLSQKEAKILSDLLDKARGTS
jgi:DNA-binding MarR family transcriptional regulator